MGKRQGRTPPDKASPPPPTGYTVEIADSARRQLTELAPADAERLVDAIDDLAEDPRPPGGKKLATKDGYRIRKGQYRVLYTIDDKLKRVRIYRVDNRRDVYK